MKSLFDIIRDECPRGLWARGVKLARAEAVFHEQTGADEVVLRVRAPELEVPPTVVLYPANEEWDCDCPSPASICAHVAAAIIAANQASERGEPLPSLRASGRQLTYRFVRKAGALLLERWVDDREVTEQLAALSNVVPTQQDFDVDAVMRELRGRVPHQRELVALVAALDGCRHVELDGHPVYTSPEVVLPLGVVRDHDKGVRLEVVANPDITEVVGDGIALCGDTLQPLGHTEITGARLEQLPFGKFVEPAAYAELVTETIPQLEADIPVDIRTTRLPELTQWAEPRIELDVQQGDALSILPTLVYGTPPIARIDGDRMHHLRGPAPVRDRAKEREVLATLRDSLNLVPGRRVEYRGNDALRITEKLHAWHGHRVDRAAPEYVAPSALVPRIDFDDGFDVVFETDDAEPSARRSASATAVIGAWQSGLDLTPLEAGGWATLPSGWLAAHGDLVADLLAARDERGALPTFATPMLAKLCDELGTPRPPMADALRTLLEGFEGVSTAPLPEDFTGELRDYQRTGVNWLCALRDAGLGALLADDMGLGKTVQALCAVTGRTLVVCPTSVMPTWAKEIARFRPGLRVSVFHGPNRELDAGADITLTTYGVLRIDATRLREIRWDTAILDEAQTIKNPQSGVARAAHTLDAHFRIALSGTPVENRLDELWSQFHFVNRGLLGDRRYFQKRYARPIARQEPGAAARLRDRIRPFLLRRLKQDVERELPPRTDSLLYCELDEAERNVYDAIRAATREDVVARLRKGGNVIAALEALLRLRQAACHRSLVPGQTAKSSSKLRELLTALDGVVANGHKALVFSQWTSLLDLVEPHLHEAGLAFTRLDGSTRDRGAVVDGFQSEDGPPIMLVSLKAGGVGLTLTAADHVYLLDPWWNPAVEDQAADRTHRIGQDRPVMVYRVVAADTVESRILALQESKRQIAEAALGDADKATSLTREDLLALLD